jgi:hypothetical protein
LSKHRVRKIEGQNDRRDPGCCLGGITLGNTAVSLGGFHRFLEIFHSPAQNFQLGLSRFDFRPGVHQLRSRILLFHCSSPPLGS